MKTTGMILGIFALSAGIVLLELAIYSYALPLMAVGVVATCRAAKQSLHP